MIQAKLIAIGAVLIVLLLGGWYIRHAGYKAGERAVRAEWQAATDAAEADYRAREAELRRQSVTLSFELQDLRASKAALQQDLQHALSRGVLTVTVPGKCPAPGPESVRLWNVADNPPSGATSPR